MLKILVNIKCGKKESRVAKIRVGDKFFENGEVKDWKAVKLDLLKTKQHKENLEFFIETTKRPIDGEANVDIIKILSEFFKVSKSKINLKTGGKSKIKIFEIDN